MLHCPSGRGRAGGRRRRAKTSEEMDFERKEAVAVKYLCRLGEARDWIERCLGMTNSEEEVKEEEEDEDASVVLSAMSGGLVAFEESLRNGVVLARLASVFAPEVVPTEKIFDSDLERYDETGLSYRHTDNVYYFIEAVRSLGLPEVSNTKIFFKKFNLPSWQL